MLLSKKMENNILNKISPNEALTIILYLAKSDNEIKKKIINIAEDLMKEVDLEEISEEVFSALDGIDVHELWDRSGAKSNGYTSPEDMAVEMMEEELEPFNQEVFRLCELNMLKEAMLYCMGVLKGIYRFSEDSKSEFKDWSIDIPEECFGYLLDKWREKCKDKKYLKKMNEFIETECYRWSKWALQKL